MCEKRCDGCAFTKGSDANLEPDNFLKGIICQLTPMPFYCHETFDWKNPELDSIQDIKDLPKSKRICQGWKESVAELAKTGYFKENPKSTKIYGKFALSLLHKILGMEECQEKELLWQQFRETLSALRQKRRRFENNASS